MVTKILSLVTRKEFMYPDCKSNSKITSSILIKPPPFTGSANRRQGSPLLLNLLYHIFLEIAIKTANSGGFYRIIR